MKIEVSVNCCGGGNSGVTLAGFWGKETVQDINSATLVPNIHLFTLDAPRIARKAKAVSSSS